MNRRCKARAIRLKTVRVSPNPLMVHYYSQPMKPASSSRAGSLLSRPLRWALASLGVACVGIGAVGVFVPGLPTTVFVIAATWCFAKSCPWMEERLVRNRLFAPVLAYVDRTAPIPLRAKVISIAAMWLCVATSIAIVRSHDVAPLWVALLIAAAACVGTACILRWDAGVRRDS